MTSLKPIQLWQQKERTNKSECAARWSRQYATALLLDLWRLRGGVKARPLQPRLSLSVTAWKAAAVPSSALRRRARQPRRCATGSHLARPLQQRLLLSATVRKAAAVLSSALRRRARQPRRCATVFRLARGDALGAPSPPNISSTATYPAVRSKAGPCSLSLPRAEAASAAARRLQPRSSPATSSHGGGRRSPSPFRPALARPRRRPPSSAKATNSGVGRPAAASVGATRARSRSPFPAAASSAQARPAAVPRPPRVLSRPCPPRRRPPASIREDASPEPAPTPPGPAVTASAVRRASAPSSNATPP